LCAGCPEGANERCFLAGSFSGWTVTEVAVFKAHVKYNELDAEAEVGGDNLDGADANDWLILAECFHLASWRLWRNFDPFQQSLFDYSWIIIIYLFSNKSAEISAMAVKLNWKRQEKNNFARRYEDEYVHVNTTSS
jgi:hypothetical protein